MPQPKGRNVHQVNKCNIPYPITSVTEEVNGVKRKIPASQSVGLAKKSKQGLQYCNAADPANSTRKDEVANTSTTTIITDKLSQHKDEPLKFQELQNIKKVIRNWKPPPLRKRDEVDLTKKDVAKPKEALKKIQQENTTKIKGSEVIMSTLASVDLVTQKDALQNGGHTMLPGEDTPIAKSVPKQEPQEDKGEGIAEVKEPMPSQSTPREREVVNDEMDELIIEDSQADMETCTNSSFKNKKFREHAVVIDVTESQMKVPNSQDEDLFGEGILIAKSVAKQESQEDNDKGIAEVKQAMPSQSTPREREVVNDEMDELIIEDSQEDMKTCTNSSFKNEKFREHAVVIDLTGSQIKVPNSQDLFEGEDDIYTESSNNEVSIDLTDILIQENNSQDTDLFEGEEEKYTDQYSSLKLKIHSAMGSKLEVNDKVPSCHADTSNQSEHSDGVTLPDSCRLTDDLCVTPAREDMCTPTNDVNLLDTTPPTVKRIPHKERNFCTNEIDTANESNCGEKRPEVCTMTDDTCVTLRKSQKLSTFKESPKLFPDMDSEEDFEKPKQKLQDDKLPLADTYEEQSQEDMDFGHQLSIYKDQEQSKIQVNISDKCLTVDELPTENSSEDIECAGEKELCLPKNMQISAANDIVHLTLKNLFEVKNDNQDFQNESTNVISQSQSIRSMSRPTTCQNAQNESDNIRSENKGTIRFPDNGTEKSQNEASTALASTQNTKGSNNFHRKENTVVQNNDRSKNTNGPASNKENNDNGPTTNDSQTFLNKASYVNNVTPLSVSLSPQHNFSQKSLNGSNSTVTPNALNKESKDGPTTNASQTCLNKPCYALPTNNNVTPLSVSLSPQHNVSQKSLNGSNSTETPNAISTNHTSQNTFNNCVIALNNNVNPHSMLQKKTQYNESQKSLNGLNGTSTPNKENKDFPSARLTSKTYENGSDKSIVGLSDVKPHSMPLAPQEHNASQKSVSGLNITTTPNTEDKDLPSAYITSLTKNKANNTSTNKTGVEDRTSSTKKAVQTPKSQPVNVLLESNDVKENRQPYLYEMDQDFDLISSSQLLAIEDELKQEMLKETAYKSGNRSKPNVGQIAPRHIPMTCESARAPIFSITTMPPLQQPFDWTQKVRDDRQKLRGIVQEMTNLNAMITKVRREMWPRRRPDEGSGSVVIRRPDEIMAPPLQAGPSTYGTGLPPGNWGRGHSSRY